MRHDALEPTLAQRLGVPALIPAVAFDPPPRKGRTIRLQVFEGPCETHVLDRLEAVGITHPLASADAVPYRVFRAIPKGAPPPGGWPVLYMLDGNVAFDCLTHALLASVPGLAVIGIGQATDAQFEPTSRARDLTFPAPGQTGLTPDPDYGNRPAGGAPQFIPLLVGALRERAEQGLHIDPARRAVWGHSLGGMFVLTLMLRAPTAFARYAAISPSLWWHPERFGAALDGWLATPPAGGPTPLYLGSGNREQRSGSGGPPPTDAPQAFFDLITRLEASGRFDLIHQVYDSAIHVASIPSSLATSLRFAAL